MKTVAIWLHLFMKCGQCKIYCSRPKNKMTNHPTIHADILTFWNTKQINKINKSVPFLKHLTIVQQISEFLVQSQTF